MRSCLCATRFMGNGTTSCCLKVDSFISINVLTHMVAAVAQDMGAYLAPYQAIDTVPVPLMRRRRGKRHRLFGPEAAIGRGGGDRDWYYGCKLLLAVTPQGVCTGFVLAPANTEDRWAAEAFLCWRHAVCQAPIRAQEFAASSVWSGVCRADWTCGSVPWCWGPEWWPLCGGQRLLWVLVAGALAGGLWGVGADAQGLCGGWQSHGAACPYRLAPDRGDHPWAPGAGLWSALPWCPQSVGSAKSGCRQIGGLEPGYVAESALWSPWVWLLLPSSMVREPMCITRHRGGGFRSGAGFDPGASPLILSPHRGGEPVLRSPPPSEGEG